MVEKFTRLGGKISYNNKVEKIIVEENRAKGVVLQDGTIIPSDYVISAADGYTTLYKMLEGNYRTKEIEDAYRNWELFPSFVQVSFGINKPSMQNRRSSSISTRGISIGRTELNFGYSVMNYSYDNTMAPEGKTTIVMRFDSFWELWKDLEGEEYRQEKEEIRKDAIACLERIYPGISDSIEVIDVATPKTDVRYTGVKEGAYEGFMPSRENMMKIASDAPAEASEFLHVGTMDLPGRRTSSVGTVREMGGSADLQKEKQLRFDSHNA